MPGAPGMFLDTGAPAQYVWSVSSPPADIGGPMNGYGNSQQSSTFDTMLHWKVGGTVILALVTVFILQYLGFRFVVAAGFGG